MKRGSKFFKPPDHHRNEGLPSWSEVCRALHTQEAATWPLHLKPVRQVNLPRIRALANKHQKLTQLNAATRILHDATFYAPVEIDPTYRPTCKYSPEEIQEMVEKNFIEETNEAPLGWVRKFPAPEHMKQRRRDISHTISVNELPRQGHCNLPTTAQKIRSLHKGFMAIVFDFAACFSSYFYDPEVRQYFCFYAHGKMYRLCRLAMGQTHSCDLAQQVLELVLDEVCAQAGIPRDQAFGHIDNGLIVGDAKQLEKAVEALIGWCDTLGITLNKPDEIVPAKIVEFTGLILNYEMKTVALSQKTVEKAKLLAAARELDEGEASIRLLAATFGITMYAHSIFRDFGIRCIAASRYHTCRFMAGVAALAEADRGLWDNGTVQIPLHICSQLREWLLEVARNVPQTVFQGDVPRTKILVTDASADRWAGILFDATTWEMNIAQGQFPPGLQCWRKSTQAEPWAIWYAAEEVTARGLITAQDEVLILSDHMGMIAAWPRGSSPNWSYNTVIQKLKETPPWNRAILRFIPGCLNIADEPTRGKPIMEEKAQIIRTQCDLTGTGTGWSKPSLPELEYPRPPGWDE